jgi:hypothetical protein
VFPVTKRSIGSILTIKFIQRHWEDAMRTTIATVLVTIASGFLAQPASAQTWLEFLFDEGGGTTAVNTGTEGGAANGTLHGPQWVTDTPSLTGYALSFEGDDDRITIPDTFDYGDAVTVEAWIKPSEVVGQNGVWDDYGNPGVILYVFDGEIRFAVSTSQDPGVGANLYAGTVTPGAWQHIAGVYDGVEMRVYINGIQAAQVLATNGAIFDNGPIDGIIGNDQSGTLGFNGVIDDARVHGEALAPDQLAGGVMYLLTDGFESGDTSGWSAVWP